MGMGHYTTLVFWHAWPSPDQHILVKLVDRYNQSHPMVHVVLQPMSLASLTRELRAAAMAGSGPHVVLLQSHTIGDLAMDGILLPLDHLVSSEKYENLLPSAVQGVRVQEAQGISQLYGLPLTFDTLALYYNKASMDKPPSDVAMFSTGAYGLHTRTTQSLSWGLAYTLSLDKTIGYLYAFGGRIFDAEGNLVLGTEGRSGTERWLEWLMELNRDQHVLAVSDSITVDNALKAQKALMTIDWSHALPSYQALWGDDLGIAMLPRVGTTAPQPYVQSDVVGINTHVVDTENQQAALDFVHYLVNEDSQKVLLDVGKQPSLLQLNLEGETPIIEAARVFRTQAQEGRAMPNNRVFNEIVWDELERMQLAVLRGLETPPDAVTQADVALRERLRPYGGFDQGIEH